MLRTIRSAHQLSIYRAISSWCIDLAEKMHGQTSTGVDSSISEENDQLSKQLDPQEVGSLVRNQPKTEGDAGNCCCDHLQRFDMMNPDAKLRTVREEAGFIRPVSKRMYYITGEGVNDGFGNLIASCREYTLSRTHRDSEVKLWIQKYTEIGPARAAKIICPHDVHGLEIRTTSTSGDDTNVWVVISRGPNRYLDELRYRDSEISLEEADYECMQDTDQEQSTIQLEMSNDHIPTHERKWKDITANECSYKYTWESQISKFVSKLARNENCGDRETNGAIQ